MEYTIVSELPGQEKLFALYDKLGWNNFLNLAPEQLLAAMKSSWFSLYAYSGDSLVGTGRVISDGLINAYMCGIGVSSSCRGQGIGTEICRRLIAQCRLHNLHVQLFCGEDLVPFYQRLGFARFAQGMKLI